MYSYGPCGLYNENLEIKIKNNYTFTIYLLINFKINSRVLSLKFVGLCNLK